MIIAIVLATREMVASSTNMMVSHRLTRGISTEVCASSKHTCASSKGARVFG